LEFTIHGRVIRALCKIANDQASQTLVPRPRSERPIQHASPLTWLAESGVDRAGVIVRTFVGLDPAPDPLRRRAEAIEVEMTADRVDVTGRLNALGRDHFGASAVLRLRSQYESRIVGIVCVPLVIVMIDPHGEPRP
jgi:hypothetical protein